MDDVIDEVNDAFAETGEISPEMGGGFGSPRGGGGGPGLGTAGGVGALASKLPKSVGAVGAGATAALPVALAGGVGVGLLSAMGSASARLQTSASLLGVAVDNFFREPGNILDETIVRPITQSILGISLEFDKAARAFGDAVGGDIIPPSFENAGKRLQKAGEAFQELPLPTWADTFFQGMERAGRLMRNFPGWPNVKAQWSGWPDIPSIDLGNFVTGINLGNFIEVPDILSGDSDPGGPTPGRSSAGGSSGASGGGPSGGGGGGGTGDLTPIATGGRVTRSGAARVHRGELVADPDRLVSDLADAIDGAGGGRSAPDVDMSNVESKLDTLHRDIQRLARAMDGAAFEVDGERFGELSTRTQERASDTDPLSGV